MKAIKLRASIGFGNLGYYYCQCQSCAFCKINHEGEYYSKPEADAVIARLEGVILEFEKLRNEKKDKIIDYRKRGEIAETGLARLTSELFQAQAKSSRLEAMCGDLQDDIAKRDHQIEVLNVDLTRCQDSKAKFGDKILRLQAAAENVLFKRRQNATLTDADFEWLERAVEVK